MVFRLGGSPHPVIVAIQDNKDYITGPSYIPVIPLLQCGGGPPKGKSLGPKPWEDFLLAQLISHIGNLEPLGTEVGERIYSVGPYLRPPKLDKTMAQNLNLKTEKPSSSKKELFCILLGVLYTVAG